MAASEEWIGMKMGLGWDCKERRQRREVLSSYLAISEQWSSWYISTAHIKEMYHEDCCLKILVVE